MTAQAKKARGVAISAARKKGTVKWKPFFSGIDKLQKEKKAKS